jgi:hypothetical protein
MALISPIKKDFLRNHIQKKQQEINAISNDPILNHPNEFYDSIQRIVAVHKKVFPNFKDHAIVCLGNSFSWQSHLINYFAKEPTSKLFGIQSFIIPYSSSYLEESSNKSPSSAFPYQRRDGIKGIVNQQTKSWVLSNLKTTSPFSLIDMTKTGAGLASFLIMSDNTPHIILFEPNTQPNQISVSKNKYFCRHHTTNLNVEYPEQLETMCDEGIRGSIQTKIYEPVPTMKHPTLFYLKKSILIKTIAESPLSETL